MIAAAKLISPGRGPWTLGRSERRGRAVLAGAEDALLAAALADPDADGAQATRAMAGEVATGGVRVNAAVGLAAFEVDAQKRALFCAGVLHSLQIGYRSALA